MYERAEDRTARFPAFAWEISSRSDFPLNLNFISSRTAGSAAAFANPNRRKERVVAGKTGLRTLILRSALFGLTAGAMLLALLTNSASAEPTKIKLVLNWKYQGPQGMFFLADDKGYFKEEGLDVTLDQG